jgi:hypothetical protein
MKTYRAMVIRVQRTEVVYSTDIHNIPAESEDEARREAELILPRLPGVEDEGWCESEPETSLLPPEIRQVWDEAEYIKEYFPWLEPVLRARADDHADGSGSSPESDQGRPVSEV